MAKLEASNLTEYSPNQLKLLLRGIALVKVEEDSSVASRNDMLNGEDMSVPFAMRQRKAIKNHQINLEDLLAMKIAIQTNLDYILKHEKTLNH